MNIFDILKWRRYLTFQQQTAERELSILRNLSLIIFEGAPKTGKYVLTEKGMKIIKELSL